MGEGLFQPTHLLVILIVALILFGPKKIPELGKGLGEGIKNFKDSMKEGAAAATAKTETKTETRSDGPVTRTDA